MAEHVDPASCAGPRRVTGRWRTTSLFIRLYLLALAPALVGLLAVAIDPGFAETAFSFAPGDSAMSGFSGTVLSLPSLPPGVSPIDKTVIDVDAPSLSVFDLSTLGGAPQGRAVSPAVKLSIKAKDIGQVFPLAFDTGEDGGPPNLYAAATSAYGLQIMSSKPDADGSPVRLKVGGPDAQFMKGQFGGLPGGDAGTIWKIDGGTGAVTALADTALSGVANSGPGIGGLAYDPVSHMLYASDLDTGLIHRFALDHNAADLDQFDHGVTGRPSRALLPVPDDGKRADITNASFKVDDPSTWGFTQSARRVRALAVHNSRLYYSVDEGPEIWSVGLNQDGSFGTDPRSELLAKGDSASPVTNIAFDAQGRMLLAQRGAQKGAYDYGAFVDAAPTQVLRYTVENPDNPATPGIWSPTPDSYAAGFASGGKAASGGLSLQYGYRPDGTLDANACQGTIALTADGITEDGNGHGAQLNAVDLVLPANLPPKQSAFIDFNIRQDAANFTGHAGDVKSYQPCAAGAGFPPVAGGAPGGFPPLGGAGGFPPIGGAGGFPPVGGAGGFPPIAGGGGSALPPIQGGGGETAPPVEGGGTTQTPPEPDTPTVQDGSIKLTKVGVSPGCNEQKACTYKVTVQNTSAAPVPGPITISDVLSANNQTLAKASINGSAAPGWLCSMDGPRLVCTHGDALAANATETLDVSFTPGPLGDAKEVRNCVSLSPGEQADLPPNVVEDIRGLRVELTPVSPSCASGVPCAWTIIATNTGSVPIDSPEVRFTPAASVNGSFVPFTNLVLVNSLVPIGAACAVSAGGGSVECKGAPSIAPGASLTVGVSTQGNAPEKVEEFTALGFVEGKAGGKDSQGGSQAFMRAGGAGATAPKLPPSTAGMKVNEAETAAIFVQLKTTPRACTKDGECTLTLQAGNFSQTALQGVASLQISATSSAGGTSAPVGDLQIVLADPAAGQCAVDAQKAISCQGAQIVLPPNGTKEFVFKVKVTPPAGTTPDFFQFTGNFTLSVANAPAGTPPLGVAATTAAALSGEPATAGGGGAAGGGAGGAGGAAGAGGGAGAPVKAQPLKACASIPVVPKTLTLTKTALVPSCSDTGGGCNFNISIANGGDDDFEGVVEIEDTVTADGAFIPTTGKDTNADAGFGWTCANKGQSFSCKSSKLKIPAKGKEDISIGFKLGSATTAKEIKNCAKLIDGPESCATIPLKSGPILRVRKSTLGTHCTPDGDKAESCTFAIFVFNVGNQPFNGPLNITDTFTPTGTSPAVLTSFSGGGQGANAWACTGSAGTPGVHNCENKSATIAVGGTLDATTTLAPISKSPTYENCAELTGQAAVGSDQTKSCATVRDLETPPEAEPANPRFAALSIAKTADGTSCAPEGNCAFTITVTNTGTESYSDFLEIRDQLKDANGTPLSRARLINDAPAPWNCGESGGGFFFCQQSNALIEPGKSISVKMGFAPHTTVAQQIENCASIEGGTAPPACAKIGVQPPPPVLLPPQQVPLGIPNLATRASAKAPTCPLAGPCVFHIEVVNAGNSDYKGRAEVTNAFTQGAGLGATAKQVSTHLDPANGYACTPEAGLTTQTCNHPPLTLTPNQAAGFDIVVTPGPGWTKNNVLQVCATIMRDAGGNDDGGNTKDDTACAQVTLDPFAVSITKKGDQSCKPGSECHFTLDIFDPGPIIHDAPVTVSDNLVGLAGAKIVSITQVSGNDPFPCSPAPTSLPFSCSGRMLMDVGEHNVYSMVVQLPADMPAQGSFSNCASVSEPKAGAAQGPAATGGTPGADQFCHQVNLEPACTGGMELTKEGRCACPAGTTWDGRSCATAQQCPAGTTGTYPNCQQGTGGTNKTKAGEDTCPADRPVGTPPNCCPTGTEFKKGKCRAVVTPQQTCPADRPVGTPPNCCPTGTEFKKGRCRSVATPQQTCPADRPVGTPPNCCPQGTTFTRGACRAPETAPPTCPPDRPIGTPPNCCPQGTAYNNGMCRSTTCPPGTVGVPPICIPQKQKKQKPQEQQPEQHQCPDGYRVLDKPNKYGAYCEPIEQAPPQCPADRPVGTPPNCCPQGTHFTEGSCYPLTCSPGWTGAPPHCQPPPTQQAPAPTGPAPKCPSYMVGTPPNCYCPPGTTGDRCESPAVH